jgi:anti-sigma factor RsiW
MTCHEIRPLVEAIAAGDLEIDDTIRGHIESCPACAAQLASAQRIELLLKARPAPKPPENFTTTVLGRIRREQWQHEEHVDRVFNIAIVAAVLLVLGGIAALTNVGAVIGLAGSAFGLLGQATGRVAAQSAPTATTYVAAAGLLMSTLFMWWWAERRLSL